MDNFFGQLPFKCRWHLWKIDIRFALNWTPGWFLLNFLRVLDFNGPGSAEPGCHHRVEVTLSNLTDDAKVGVGPFAGKAQGRSTKIIPMIE